jgi:hypothetical protein
MAAKMLSIRAKQGLMIRNPLDGKVLPADRNTRVDESQYWLRRLKDGDVYEASEEPKKIDPPKAEKKEKISKKNRQCDEKESD